jgi:hypothetical protein
MTNSLIPSNGSLKKIGSGVGVAGLVGLLYILGVVDIAPGNSGKIHAMQIDIAVIKTDVKALKEVVELKCQ